MTQTAARIVARPYSYAGAGDAFAYFHNCIYYEPVLLPDGTPAFSLFDQCAKGFFSWNYVEKIIEQEVGGEMTVRDDRLFNRRTGYCPVIFEGEFAKAKTLLPPGYRSTPEHRLLGQLPEAQRQRFETLINAPISSYLKDGMFQIPQDFFDVMLHFHKAIPQVVRSSRPLYDSF